VASGAKLQPTNDLVHTGVKAALVAAVCVDFPEIKCANSWRPVRSYSSWGTCHHCPMEVGAYVMMRHFAKCTTFRD